MSAEEVVFKPGDLVICINGYRDGPGAAFITGQIYTVREMTPWGSVGIVKDSSGSTTNGWGINRFKLAEKIISKNKFNKKFDDFIS